MADRGFKVFVLMFVVLHVLLDLGTWVKGEAQYYRMFFVGEEVCCKVLLVGVCCALCCMW